jgi:adenosylcobinamide kinase / adenosylcobinamide-phosphate guanylyltransferase
VEVVALGTGGPDGVPAAGCSCPACLAAAADPVLARSPDAVLLDGALRLAAGDATDRRTADGARLLWLPAADDLTDAAVTRLAGTPAARFAVLGARTPTGAAHALARLRAAGAVDGGTGCALVGHRHDWPPTAEVSLRARHWGLAVPLDGEPVTAGPAAGQAPGSRLPRRTLVLGGIRSGKSALAEDLLAAEPSVVYLAATGHPDVADGGPDGGPDGEWARRVAAHRERRPAWWRTVEGTDLTAAWAGDAPVLLDSVGSWLAATLDGAGAWAEAVGWRDRYLAERDRLLRAWRSTPVPVVAVAEEVGSGLVPTTASGRLFTDELGRLNQLLAAGSEQVLLCVAGRTVVVASPWAGRTASSAGTDPRAGA